MAFTAWSEDTEYNLGDIRRAVAAQESGLVFKVTAVSGSAPYTSGSSEPKWGTDIGSTVVDNELTWTAISSVYEELNVLNPNAIIELFELHLDETLHGSTDIYRWHNGCNDAVTGNLIWNSNTYTRQPIEADGFEYQNGGALPRPTLTISNLNGIITTLLLLVNGTTAGNDLGGATVKRIRTLKKFLDGQATADPFASFPEEVWYIDRKAHEDRAMVSFELASKFDLAGVKIPRRQLIANLCQWEYRSSECSYSGSNYWDAQDEEVPTLAQDRCGKRLSSCKKRFGDNGELPFGSFPSVGLTR